jgi:predicted DNA-binding transcriptional regulator AlpA
MVHKIDLERRRSGLLSTREVATDYGFPEMTLRYWRQRDEGPPSFRLGRRVYYRRAEVDAWLAKREAAAGGRSVRA